MLDNERVMFSHSLSLFHFALWIRWLTELYTNEHIFHQFDHYPLPNMVFLPSPIEKKFHGIKFICQSFISYKCIYLWQALQSIPWHLLFKQFYDNIILEKHKKFCYVSKEIFRFGLDYWYHDPSHIEPQPYVTMSLISLFVDAKHTFCTINQITASSEFISPLPYRSPRLCLSIFKVNRKKEIEIAALLLTIDQHFERCCFLKKKSLEFELIDACLIAIFFLIYFINSGTKPLLNTVSSILWTKCNSCVKISMDIRYMSDKILAMH